MFQRPQHPHLIVGVDDSRRFRVHLLQLGIESGTALLGQLFCQLLPQTGRCFFFGKAHPVQKALYI